MRVCVRDIPVVVVVALDVDGIPERGKGGKG